MCKDYKDETIRLLEIIVAGMERLGQPLTSDANNIDSVAQERNQIVSETLTILGRAGDSMCEVDTKLDKKRIHLKSVEKFQVKGRGLIFNIDQAEYNDVQFAIGNFVNHDKNWYEVRGIEYRGGLITSRHIGLVVVKAPVEMCRGADCEFFEPRSSPHPYCDDPMFGDCSIEKTYKDDTSFCYNATLSKIKDALPPHDTGDPKNPCRCCIARVHGSANTFNQFMVRACLDERTPSICIHYDGTIVNEKELISIDKIGETA